ncbi:hypothetical protein [Hymenobacter metallilatus]|uniref:Uncharacterized protein n=1 Tax=Hymenobacter metallilatus TaxID=2493666 RepID=A0A3R9ML36_9BACT|nr:hypothetical protein [Hymenobacter metallilatus]RSK24166.1 hypothetical protein EI290_20505 [Hymenobacter metallilatus]
MANELSGWAFQQPPYFTHITTFSLLRGQKWEQLQQAAQRLAVEGRMQLLTATAAELPARRAYLERLRCYPQPGQTTLTPGLLEAYHLTATPVATLPRLSSPVQRLETLLHLPLKHPPGWMCGPVYRDAIAFYQDLKLVRVLNICFSCEKMLLDSGQALLADVAVYAGLRQLLLELGHPIGNEEQ